MDGLKRVEIVGNRLNPMILVTWFSRNERRCSVRGIFMRCRDGVSCRSCAFNGYVTTPAVSDLLQESCRDMNPSFDLS